MELASGGTGNLGDPTLDRSVDVLIAGNEHERPVGQLAFHVVQGGQHCGRFVPVEELSSDQTSHVGARSGDVI